ATWWSARPCEVQQQRFRRPLGPVPRYPYGNRRTPNGDCQPHPGVDLDIDSRQNEQYGIRMDPEADRFNDAVAAEMRAERGAKKLTVDEVAARADIPRATLLR